jgi:hypothetical protein
VASLVVDKLTWDVDDGHCIMYDVSNLVASLLEDFKSGENNNEKPY